MTFRVSIVLLFAFISTVCGSQKDTSKQTAQKKAAFIENVSPGTAIAQFKVLKEEATTQDSVSHFTIEIVNVERYGSATPILSQGEELIIAFSNKSPLTVGKQYLGVLTYSKNLMQANTLSNWALERIN